MFNPAISTPYRNLAMSYRHPSAPRFGTKLYEVYVPHDQRHVKDAAERLRNAFMIVDGDSVFTTDDPENKRNGVTRILITAKKPDGDRQEMFKRRILNGITLTPRDKIALNEDMPINDNEMHFTYQLYWKDPRYEDHQYYRIPVDVVFPSLNGVI